MQMVYRSIHVFAWLALFVASRCAVAQELSEQDELKQFLDLLEQQTTLATKTRLNADYVPGMLSVLNAEQMQRRGFRIVWEALASLPGVITSMDDTGMRSISVRGIGELFEPGKVKLLLNGEAINASASATTGTLFNTPVEQIERIEFIRGRARRCTGNSPLPALSTSSPARIEIGSTGGPPADSTSGPTTASGPSRWR